MNTRSSLALLVTLAAGCAPEAATQNPGNTGNPAVTDGDVVHCTTAAYLTDDVTIPVAWTLTADLGAGLATATHDRAHEISDDPFDFEPTNLESAVEGELGESLSLSLDAGLTITGTRSAAFASHLWTGTLTTEDTEVDAVCWRDGFAGDFAYEPSMGDCFDADGASGRDTLPVPYVRATGDAQCATFPEGTSLNEDFLGYPVLRGLDLRGAELAGSTLFFADVFEARLEGTDLTGFEFGYARVEGTTDAHTIWPQDLCEQDGDELMCIR